MDHFCITETNTYKMMNTTEYILISGYTIEFIVLLEMFQNKYKDGEKTNRTI